MVSISPPRHAVLIVEDEPLLRMDAMDLTEEAGLVAYGAANADEAVAMLEQHEDIRILFTDIQMEGSMNGLELAHAVSQGWPIVKIMITSGVVQFKDTQLLEGWVFFSKPYAPHFFLETIQNIALRIDR